MEKTKKITKEINTCILDKNTGEILEHKEVKQFSIDGEPDYVKLYLQDIGRVFGLSSGNSSVMYALLKRMDYDNLIALTPIIRQKIAYDCNTTVDVINHAISKLVSEGIFTRLGSGTFMANPDIFARGKWVDIKNMRLSITYDSEGRTFKAERNTPQQKEIPFEGAEPVKSISGLPVWMLT